MWQKSIKNDEWKIQQSSAFLSSVIYHLPHDSGQSKCLQVKLFNNTSNRPKGCNLIKKETLAQMFSCEFCEISRNNFFYRAHPGNWFWIKFCKSYKEVCEGTSLVKFWQSCHFNIKWRKDLLKRKILNKVAGHKHMFSWCKFCEILRTPFLQKTSDWLITKDVH